MTVFANGLEIACKAQANKVIAAFPHVCMTPPQTPATPPGVPVPYPTFGMDSDTDKGTSSVKIGDKTVTQKNLSYYTKCTGNEAGCAPMKNVISHVNTGKEYAHAWSGNVKADGEPVSRFSDISTNDHASPQAGGPPMPKVGILTAQDPRCAFLKIQPYDKLDCPDGYEKEHTVEVQFLTVAGMRDHTLNCCKDYKEADAPCVCMKASWVASDNMSGKTVARADGTPKNYGPDFEGKKIGTDHYYKSADARNWTRENPGGSLGDFADKCVESSARNAYPPNQRALAAECLEVANIEYLAKSMKKSEEEVRNKKRCKGTRDAPDCPWAHEQAAFARDYNADVRSGKISSSAADKKDHYKQSSESC